MKRLIIILTLSILSQNFSTAQESISETKRLASLAKIYGFLKYYHPEVAEGNLDWDQEFTKILPEVLKASDKESMSALYIDWIESLGEIDRCKKCDSEENYFDKNFDLSWTQDTTLFTKGLASRFKYIEDNRNLNENFYVTTEYLGNIKVTNEPKYENLDLEYPNEEYRLLGLFKYWNIVEYFFPYKYLTDQNWDSVLIEMIPKIQNASDIDEYRLTLEELVAKLDDSHAFIRFSDEIPKFLPFQASHLENKAIISRFYNDSIAELNKLQLGDEVLKVNDLDVRTEADKNLKFVAGSNMNFKMKQSYDRVLSGSEDLVNLTIKRDDKIINLKVNRYDFNDFNYYKNKRKVKSKSISQHIGYINMAARFSTKEFGKIFRSFKSKKHIIVDLRAYPEVKYKMFTRFFNSEKRDFRLKYSPDISYPGRFIFKENLKTGSSRKAFKGKFILLVNEQTLSLSEFTAMAFQTADNVITVGNQTAGADGEVVVFDYLGGYKTVMTGNGVLYPDGTETQRKGVKIDIEVKPTIKGLRQGRDEVLEKAIEIAKE